MSARVGVVEDAESLITGMPAALGCATLGVTLAGDAVASPHSRRSLIYTGGCN